MTRKAFQKKSPVFRRGFSFEYSCRLRQIAVDRAEGIADLGSEQAHDGNHDDGHEREDDRVLDEDLDLFLWVQTT
ncbi:MAG: hypothetical protein MZV64_59275 [Ignavibacteriales bacterium]|nr:hypothetical protein [Ignavibacteriales bacterium]